MTPADPELVARLEERVKSLDRENSGLRKEIETMERLMDRNTTSFERAISEARKDLGERLDAVSRRVTALELFRSYLRPGIAILAVIGLAMAAQLAVGMWAAAYSSYRPPHGFPLKAPNNSQQEGLPR